MSKFEDGIFSGVFFLYVFGCCLYLYANAWGIDKITNYFNKDLHWFADACIGLITGGFGFVIGFILWLFS